MEHKNNPAPPRAIGASYDVVISGGGMVGMAMALASAQAGLRVALLEKGRLHAQLDPEFDGRVSAIALGSKHILEGIGAWENMRPFAEPILDIRVTDNHTPVFLHYDHTEIGNDPFGYIVENRYIRHALQQAMAANPLITVFDGTWVESYAVRDAGVAVTINMSPQSHLPTQQARELFTRLLIGAEGRKSPVRMLAGIKTTEWSYNQTAIVCTITHKNPHNGLAQERFLPAGPFAVLPMQNNRSSLVWVEPTERAPIYMELSDEECAQEVTERVGDYLGAISLVGKRFAYPLSLSHAKDYIGERVALIGDAAHGMHPIAGQGVNMGFRDVAVLAELIAKQHALGLDIGARDMLMHYQRWRAFDNVTMLAATDGLNRLFSSNIIPIKLARDLGLWAVGKMPGVKRLFMRNAMGLMGDLPQLMRPKQN